MKTTILLLLLFRFFVVDLVLRSKYPQVIRPFALIYNVIYTGLVAAYSAYLIYRCTMVRSTGLLILAACSVAVLAATVYFTWKNWLRDRQ